MDWSKERTDLRMPKIVLGAEIAWMVVVGANGEDVGRSKKVEGEARKEKR